MSSEHQAIRNERVVAQALAFHSRESLVVLLAVAPFAMPPKGRKAPRADVDKMRDQLSVYSEENVMKKIEERIDSNPDLIAKAIEVVQMLESAPSEPDPDSVNQPLGQSQVLRSKAETEGMRVGSGVVNIVQDLVQLTVWKQGPSILFVVPYLLTVSYSCSILLLRPHKSRLRGIA